MSNEQRAHDLALHFIDAVIKAKQQSKINEQIENDIHEITVPVDLYREYKELYDSFLEALNRDYKSSF